MEFPKTQNRVEKFSEPSRMIDQWVKIIRYVWNTNQKWQHLPVIKFWPIRCFELVPNNAPKQIRNVNQLVYGMAVCFQNIDNLRCCLQTMAPVSYLRAVQAFSLYL